jgi:Tfp pilus assembly protein FimT
MKIDSIKEGRKEINTGVKGFTTVELIIVVVVAGIMMAIALPKLSNTINNVDLHSAARQVKADIRYAQEAAMSRYRKTTITFTSNSDTYTIKARGYSESKELPARSKVIFDSGSTALIFTFNSSGEPIVGGGIIQISSGGSDKQIRVYSTTGKVSILN